MTLRPFSVSHTLYIITTVCHGCRRKHQGVICMFLSLTGSVAVWRQRRGIKQLEKHFCIQVVRNATFHPNRTAESYVPEKKTLFQSINSSNTLYIWSHDSQIIHCCFFFLNVSLNQDCFRSAWLQIWEHRCPVWPWMFSAELQRCSSHSRLHDSPLLQSHFPLLHIVSRFLAGGCCPAELATGC